MRSQKKIAFLFLIAALFFGTANIFAQFQTFPQSKSSGISGEEIDVEAKRPGNRNNKRHIEDNSKKQKIKTGKKHRRNYTCSQWQPYFSEKASQRNKTLQRQRRRNG
ncbi:MAG: hypothetical protein IPM71_03375 [Bacteroidota bacterium]|nr:MAG: hypothetical protein IPM71_03375 [Bacteroidota bacterium]